MPVVYLDSVFLLNAAMDYLLLRGTELLSGVPVGRRRCVLAALFGGSYAAVVFLPGLGGLSAWPGKLLAGLLMAVIAFGGQRRFLRRALLLFALPARALDLSRDELRALFSSLTDAESDALFAETPSIEPPYAAGMLNDEQIDSALGTLNVLRALAGLPEVTGDDELNDIAQHGAVLSAARGEITHAPEPVAGMPDDF